MFLFRAKIKGAQYYDLVLKAQPIQDEFEIGYFETEAGNLMEMEMSNGTLPVPKHVAQYKDVVKSIVYLVTE